jgi:small subunit ribosomal protein S1
MVDYNLINSLGNIDDEVNAAVMTALGDAADDMSKLVSGDEVQDFSPGAIIKGRVSSIAGDDFVVELGLKSEGILDRQEFDDPSTVEIGTEVRVLLEDVEGDTGLVKISKRKADRIINWEAIMKSKKEGDPVSGKVTKKIKGGLLVDIGVPVFLPASQVDIRRPGEISDWIGRHIDAVILKIDEERRNIVISRRKMIEVQREEMKKKTLDGLAVGELVKGTVKNIADFGAFIDLGGIDGLLHITDMSWGRVNHPSELFQVGDHVRVKVLKFNADTERVSLGLKQITEDPWSRAAEKYVPGTVVRGKVVSLKDYGAFIELEEGIEGLVHISEMSWTRRVKHPSKMVAVGDMVEAVVLDVDVKQNRISLGMKQLEPNPYEQLTEKYPPGTVVKGHVRNIADFGIFVEIEEGIDGLVHISDMSWTQRVKHPSELFQKGDEVEAVLLNIDTGDGDKPKISLGIKQLVPDPWDRIPYDYPAGKIVDGKVLKVLDFGAFVELEKGIEGLVHVSEISEDHVEDPRTVLQPGTVVKVQVLHADGAERKIGLSIKGAARAKDAAEAQGFNSSNAGGATLGDKFRGKLDKLKPKD